MAIEPSNECLPDRPTTQVEQPIVLTKHKAQLLREWFHPDGSINYRTFTVYGMGAASVARSWLQPAWADELADGKTSQTLTPAVRKQIHDHREAIANAMELAYDIAMEGGNFYGTVAYNVPKHPAKTAQRVIDRLPLVGEVTEAKLHEINTLTPKTIAAIMATYPAQQALLTEEIHTMAAYTAEQFMPLAERIKARAALMLTDALEPPKGTGFSK